MASVPTIKVRNDKGGRMIINESDLVFYGAQGWVADEPDPQEAAEPAEPQKRGKGKSA